LPGGQSARLNNVERRRIASGRRSLAPACPREPAEAGEAGDHHRPGRGFRDGRCKQRDADRAVAAIHARFQDLIFEHAGKVGAGAAAAAEVAAAPAATGEPAPAAAAVAAATGASAARAAIGEFPAESGARPSAVAAIPGGAGLNARAAAAAADAAAAPAGEVPGSALPADKEREILSRGEEMSPEASAPKPPTEPPSELPPLAPRSSTAYSPVTEAVKENIPGIVNVSAFASAAEARIARADAPASKKAFVDLIMF
jgi:hypothetical protein